MKTLIANWKNHPATIDLAKDLMALELETAQKHPTVQTVICPPVHFLSELSVLYADRFTLTTALGAQDVFWKFGEENYAVKYALIGHSDRRYPKDREGDSDAVVNQKLKIALESGVTPVLLVGEKEKTDDRQAVIEKQLTLGLAGLSAELVEQVLIAYEPVWAISRPGADVVRSRPSGVTGDFALRARENIGRDLNVDSGTFNPDTPENVLEAAKIIQNITGKKEILYGGSVNPSNITDFLSHPQISGAVVGQASLDPAQWAEILQITSEL